MKGCAIIAVFWAVCLGLWAQQADLQVNLAAAPTPAALDGELVYTVTVTNAGPDSAADVSTVLLLPTGTDLVSHQPAGVYNQEMRSLTWSEASLAIGAGLSYTVRIALPLRSVGSQIEINSLGYDGQGEPSAMLRVLPGATPLDLLQNLPAVTEPTGLVQTGDGTFYLLDIGDAALTAGGDVPQTDGRLMRLEPEGAVAVSSGDMLFNPRALVVQGDHLIVADPQTYAEGVPADGRLLAIDAGSGAQSLFAAGTWLSEPRDVINDGAGGFFVIDGNTNLIRIDASGTEQTRLTSGNFIQAPQALARDSLGQFWVADQVSGVIRIDGANYSQTVLKAIDAGNTFENPFDLIVTRADRLFVTSYAPNADPIQHVLELDTGDGSILSAQRYDGPHAYRGMQVRYLVTADLSATSSTDDPNTADNFFALNGEVLPAISTVTLNVTEAITVTDDAQIAPAVQLAVQEAVAVADNAQVQPALALQVQETVTVTDSGGPTLAVQLLVNETITVADLDLVRLAVQLAVQEQISITDLENLQADSGGPTVAGLFLPGLRGLPAGAELLLGESQWWIRFSELMQDPPGDESVNDVTNPIHYQLIAAGPDGRVDTDGCGDLSAGDDFLVAVARVQWLPESQTAAVVPDGTHVLGPGLYRLLVCGDRGLTDLEDLALDGDGDHKPGGDFQADFRVLGDNLAANPHFDRDLSGWVVARGDGVIQFSEEDAYRAATSGSALFPAAEAASGLNQCLGWPEVSFWRLGGLLRLAPEVGDARLLIQLDWYDGETCEGVLLASHQQTIGSRSTEDQWLSFAWQGEVPAQAASVNVRFHWSEAAEGARYLDRLYLAADGEVRLIDDFEGETLQLWRLPDP